MNIHSTTASRIRETDSTCTVEHRIALHYSDANCAIGIDSVVVVDKNVDGVVKWMWMTKTLQ